MKRILLAALLLLPASLFAADLTGVFPAGEAYVPPADHAPAAVSRMFVRTLAKGTTAVDLPAAGDSGMIVWTIPVDAKARPLSPRLSTPTGDVLRPRELGSLERGLRRFRFDGAEVGLDLPKGTHEVLHVMKTAAASYRLDVDLPADVAGAIVVAAEPDSAIALETWISPLSRQPGQPVTLHARLRDGETAIAGATVSARLASPRGAAGASIELTDRGDGVYTATLADLPSATPGAWQARFEANGQTAAGVRFARSGSGELMAERGSGRLDAIRTSVTNGVLRVTASAEMSIAGRYRFDAIVASGSNAVAWGEGVRELHRGTNALSLEIPIGSDARDLKVDVRLLGLDEMGVVGRVVVDVR